MSLSSSSISAIAPGAARLNAMKSLNNGALDLCVARFS
jgi:hypothetical protein